MKPIYVVTILNPGDACVSQVEAFESKDDAFAFAKEKMDKELADYEEDFGQRIYAHPGEKVYQNPEEEDEPYATYGIWSPCGGYIYNDRYGVLDITIFETTVKESTK